jgi:hypothetical protein
LSATLITGRLINVESSHFSTLIISFCPLWENDSWNKTVAVCHPLPGVNVKTTFFKFVIDFIPNRLKDLILQASLA